jgi:hypothetical protein
VVDLGFKDWVTQGILSDFVAHSMNLGEYQRAIHFDVIRRIICYRERKLAGWNPSNNDVLKNAEQDVISHYNENKDQLEAFVEEKWLPGW